jgi:hypothetical protein
MQFKATFGSLKVDKEGEVKLVLVVPQTEAGNVIGLSVIPETVFNVTVEPDEK